MFDIGFWEMGLIGIVALIVIGPERLPKVATTIGFWVGKLRAQAFNIRAEIEKEINADELREALHRQEEEMRNMRVMMQEAREKAAELEQEIHGDNKSSLSASEQDKHHMRPLDTAQTSSDKDESTLEDSEALAQAEAYAQAIQAQSDQEPSK